MPWQPHMTVSYFEVIESWDNWARSCVNCEASPGLLTRLYAKVLAHCCQLLPDDSQNSRRHNLTGVKARPLWSGCPELDILFCTLQTLRLIVAPKYSRRLCIQPRLGSCRTALCSGTGRWG